MSQTKQNVDPQEIEKFEALAARWWDPESEFKPLHDINPLRLNFIDDTAGIKTKNIIDVGCGGGILSESMAQYGARVTGIDMGQAPLSVARLHLQETGQQVDYQQITAEQMAQQNPESYDIVTCMELLEHVPDPSSTIRACAQLCKPGGHVYFSTINRNLKSFVFAIIGAEYVLQLLPKGTHQYKAFIKPSEVCRWARETELNLEQIIGMSYNPFTGEYRLTDDVSVNYITHFQK